jgi:hypothetical protein
MKRSFGIFIASCAAVLVCSPARAGTVFSIQPSTAAATPGSVGNAFDVVLTNSGLSSIAVAGFNFEVSVTNTNITLTGADFSPAAFPYIFAGNSLDETLSIPLNLPSTSGQTLDANDVYDIPLSGVTVTPGASLALGRVFFDISPGAAVGVFLVTFTGPQAAGDANNLSDFSGNLINVDNFADGTIEIVPEPGSLFLVLAGLCALAGPAGRRLGNAGRR